MKLKEQQCPYLYLGKTEPVIKSGLNSTGAQRYKCRSRMCYFTPQPKPMGYDDILREQALTLYLEGTSLRSISRILNVHHQSAANWVAASAQQLPEQVQYTTPTETVEIDELFTYIGKKQTCLHCCSGSQGEWTDRGSGGVERTQLGSCATDGGLVTGSQQLLRRPKQFICRFVLAQRE